LFKIPYNLIELSNLGVFVAAPFFGIIDTVAVINSVLTEFIALFAKNFTVFRNVIIQQYAFLPEALAALSGHASPWTAALQGGRFVAMPTKKWRESLYPNGMIWKMRAKKQMGIAKRRLFQRLAIDR